MEQRFVLKLFIREKRYFYPLFFSMFIKKILFKITHQNIYDLAAKIELNTTRRQSPMQS
jgi:hypothetical protein